jgi:hypothetical protein
MFELVGELGEAPCPAEEVGGGTLVVLFPLVEVPTERELHEHGEAREVNTKVDV